MFSSKDVTLVAISDIKIKQTIYALTKSNQLLKPFETILITSKNLTLDPKRRKTIKIIKSDRINSIESYSNFIIYKLHKYIKTSHVLIVQWDGYICNIEKWDTNFLKYDYIGAPFIPREEDPQYSRDKKGAFYVIGNGGFSLRSKKLLEAPSKYCLKDNKKFTNSNEDGFFSVLHRSFLSSKGLIWAPYNIAKKFSIESPLSFDEIYDLPFGFHGRKMIYILRFNKIKNIILSVVRLKFLKKIFPKS